MTIQQLGYFIHLSEELKFTNVARIFFITQPTLSRQIANLENELKVELFIRDRNSVKLTREGKYFYEKVKPIYQQLMSAIEETRNLCWEKDKLVIGIQEEQLISNSLALAINKLRHNHPDLKVNILRGTTETMFSGLANGKFDIINMLKYPDGNMNDITAGFEFLEIQQESTYMVISRELEGSERDHITKTEFCEYLEKYELFLPDIFPAFPEKTPRQLLMSNYGFDSQVNITTVQSGTPISLPIQVAAQLGISICNRTNMFSIDPEIKMMKIDDTSGSYYKGIFYMKNVENPYVKELVKLTKDENKKYLKQ